jgi:hypothetical protein
MEIMLDTTCLAVSALAAHTHINPETQPEPKLAITRVLNNAPTGITVHQKQLALVVVLEELTNTIPAAYPVNNSLALIATMLLGPRLLSAVSVKGADVDPERMQ